MHYQRVIPRDLFNESKLLKCIGQLVLFIHDCVEITNIQFDHDSDAFNICLTEAGELYIDNIYFRIGNTRIFFSTPYNSKSPYPLLMTYNNIEYEVFTDSGKYTKEFKQFCNLFK